MSSREVFDSDRGAKEKGHSESHRSRSRRSRSRSRSPKRLRRRSEVPEEGKRDAGRRDEGKRDAGSCDEETRDGGKRDVGSRVDVTRDEGKHRHHSGRHHHSSSHRHHSSKSHDDDDGKKRKTFSPPPSKPSSAAAAAASNPLGAPPPADRLITDDNFASHATPFRLWLKQSKGLVLFDMDRDDARAYFSKFVKNWNAGALDARMYDTNEKRLHDAADTEAPRTAHQWGFTAALDDRDRQQLDSLNASVARETHVQGAIQAHVVYPVGMAPPAPKATAAPPTASSSATHRRF